MTRLLLEFGSAAEIEFQDCGNSILQLACCCFHLQIH